MVLFSSVSNNLSKIIYNQLNSLGVDNTFSGHIKSRSNASSLDACFGLLRINFEGSGRETNCLESCISERIDFSKLKLISKLVIFYSKTCLFL